MKALLPHWEDTARITAERKHGMAGVYKAGTLYVDVVPSMKGFFKSVEADAKAQLPKHRAERR